MKALRVQELAVKLRQLISNLSLKLSWSNKVKQEHFENPDDKHPRLSIYYQGRVQDMLTTLRLKTSAV